MTEVRVRGAHATVRGPGIEDEVAVEEPLEIRVDGAPLAVTMRTPGDDEELALGFLHGEGLIDGPRDGRPAGGPRRQHRRGHRPAAARARQRARSTRPPRAGCAARARWRRSRCTRRRSPTARAIARDLLADLPDRLRQPTFARTGGLHATGLFTPDGELLAVREDVGRHNAMDKVIGWALRDGPRAAASATCCACSGRLSFELVQKAAVAGAPILVGVGAPTLARGPARRRPRHHAVRASRAAGA